MKRYIPIFYDKIFKKMFGDPDNTDKLAYLLSAIFKMPYKDFKDNIVILESEKRVTTNDEKVGKNDIVLKIEFSSFGKINLEMNVGFYKEVIVRNVGYITSHFSSFLKAKDDYSDIKPIIQINFNTYDIDKRSNSIIDLYTLRNNNSHELTNMLQIFHINIEKWYKCWYNGDMEGYSEEDKKLIRMLALLSITNEQDFTKCIGETDMEEKTRKDFVNTMDELCSDEELENYYGSAEELEKLRRYGEVIIRQEALEEGQKEKSIEIARRMLEHNMEIDTISKLTDLSKTDIEKLC